MALTPDEAVQLIGDELLPKFQSEKTKLDVIDKWARWDHDDPHKPRHATQEYRELSARAQAPWGDLVVTSLAQTLYVEGYRSPESSDEAHGWSIWQANGMDGRQVPLHKAVLTYGLAYGTCLPGKTLAGDPMPVMRGESPREMIAVYDDPANDDWPIYALRVARVRKGWKLTLFDEEIAYSLRIKDLGDKPTTDGTTERHDAGVCPVVRYKNRFDLEGRAAGEIEPFIPLLGRIDQTTFDRLVVQRFASWKVRTIAGMSVAESAAASGENVEQTKMRLRAEDFLTAEDKDTKFGVLAETPLDGFIKAEDADKIDLAALTQTPAFELLGQLANIGADALAAVKSSQTAKSEECRHTLGEDHEQFIRLACHIAGDAEGAADFSAQVRWADTSIRSLAQAADGLGKLATMLQLPPEVLWRMVPGLTQQDIEEAKGILEKQGGVALLQQIANGMAPAPAA